MGKLVWFLVALVAYFGGLGIGAPGYGMQSSQVFPNPESKPVASENAENKQSAPQAEAVRDEAQSQQQLKQALGKHMKSKHYNHWSIDLFLVEMAENSPSK